MAYIYQADIYCDSCGESICQRLREGATQNQLAEWGDEHNYDSDEFPKHADDDEETDCPQHCGSGAYCLQAIVLPSGDRIGDLIGTSLTDYGASYVRGAISQGGEVAEYWKEAFSDCL